MILTITNGAELPTRTLTWKSADGAVIQFGTDPHDFELHINTDPAITKSTGIVGSNNTPNVLMTWIDGETDDYPVGQWSAQLWAKRRSDSLDREPINLMVQVRAAI